MARLVCSITQTHCAQILASNLLDMVDSLNQVWHKYFWVFCCWEVAESRHSLVHCAWDLVCSLLRHLGRIRPVILASEHVDRTVLSIYGRDPRTAIPTAKIEVQVAVEDLEYPSGTDSNIDTGLDLTP